MSKCLYNGVELPALPEWDKEAYPYATIMRDTKSGLAGTSDYTAAIFTRVPMQWSTNHLTTVVTTEPYQFAQIDHLKGETEWSAIVDKENGVSTSIYTTAIWANHDVYHTEATGGGVYLAATEPVPVGGGEPIDPTSFMQGYIVGRRLAGMRK